MRVVPYPVPGSASSGTVVFRVPCWNWTPCTWSHFGYWALPFLVRSFLGPVRAEILLLQSIYLDSFVTEHAPKPENEENKLLTQYRKWDFSLPVMVPLLEMGVPFPALVNCAFGYLHKHSELQVCCFM
jgi:hypothetical protein